MLHLGAAAIPTLRLTCKNWSCGVDLLVRWHTLRLAPPPPPPPPHEGGPRGHPPPHEQLAAVSRKFTQLQRLLLHVSPRLTLAQQLLALRTAQQHAAAVPQLRLQLAAPFQDALLVQLMGLPRLAALSIAAPSYSCQGGLEQLSSCAALTSLEVALSGGATGQAALLELLGQATALRGLRSLALHAPGGRGGGGQEPAAGRAAPQLPAGLRALALSTPEPLARLPCSLGGCGGLTSLRLDAAGPAAYGAASAAAAVAGLARLQRLSLAVQSADELALALLGCLAAADAQGGAGGRLLLPRLQALELQSRCWPSSAAAAAEHWRRLAAALPGGAQLLLQLGAPRWPLLLQELPAAAEPGGPGRGAAAERRALSALAALPCLTGLALHADCITSALAWAVAGLPRLTRLHLSAGCFMDPEEEEEGLGGLALEQQDGDRHPSFPGLGRQLACLGGLADVELSSQAPSHALRTGCFAALQRLRGLTRLVCSALFELDQGLDAAAGAPGFQLPAALAALALGRRGSSNWSDNWFESAAFAAQLAALQRLQRLEVRAAACGGGSLPAASVPRRKPAPGSHRASCPPALTQGAAAPWLRRRSARLPPSPAWTCCPTCRAA